MGAEGIEPPSPGLEPGIIPVYYAPLRKLRNISFNAFLLNFYTLFHIYKNEICCFGHELYSHLYKTEN